MKVAELLDAVEASPKWQSIVFRDDAMVVVEVDEGLRDGRTQYVEVYGTPKGDPIIRRTGAVLRLPDRIQLVTRVAWQAEALFDDNDEDDEIARTIGRVLWDFKSFGHVRLPPYHCVTTTMPARGLTLRDLETMILAIGYIGDVAEHAVFAGEVDDF